jgi:hypothetical protein
MFIETPSGIRRPSVRRAMCDWLLRNLADRSAHGPPDGGRVLPASESINMALLAEGGFWFGVGVWRLVPFISQWLQVLAHDALDAARFSPAITVICDQRRGLAEPELRAAILSVGGRVSGSPQSYE